MFSRLKQRIPVYAPLGAGLLVITLITALGGILQYTGQLNSQLFVNPPAPAVQLAAAHQNSAAAAKSAKAGSSPSSSSQTGNSIYETFSYPAPGQASPAGTGATTTAAYSQTDSAAQAVVSVRLSVNGQSKGAVKLTAGSNQCDVLSQALAERVISSLDMRYDSQLETEGIYVIDGIGSPDSVWWTYTINGHAPPYGCSYVTAHNDDSVNWQYVKT